MNGKVIIISFGLREGALKWMQETQCPFDMLLDAGRKVYHAFGLKRSVYKVWGVAAMVYYAEQMMEGKPLPKPYENIHDDTKQMGGDFILDKEGRAKFLYPSKTSSDRPDISVLLDVLKVTKILIFRS
ncbi:hypothetical protein ACJMK2_036318 [Sinanodonta woodiana]|uniref:Uncharacterized protein n=1 Tax=Sinanodonta woodiana TaxID=1069815 RepID=A0ABD3WGV2_SINWO